MVGFFDELDVKLNPSVVLSFMKLSDSFQKKLVSLQRLLCGGSKRGLKVAWVKWEDVSKAKREVNLSVKDLRLVTLALLSK